MSVRNYHSIAGLLIGHDVDGANPVGYLSGQVGSITATTNTAGAVVNTYRPKPYGQRLAKTGVGADPPFEWTGNSGSRKTGLSHSEQYNQARHYDSITTRWTTVDPIWPIEPQYLYCGATPTNFIDPLGEQPKNGMPPLLDRLKRCLKLGRSSESCFRCAYSLYRSGHPSGEPLPGYPGMSPRRACENASAYCHIPNKECGPCGPDKVPDGYSGCPGSPGEIDRRAKWIREHCGEYSLPGKPIKKINPALGADKIAHCYAACCASYWFAPAIWDAITPPDDDPRDREAEKCGKDIGWNYLLWSWKFFSPPNCFELCAEATNEMLFTP